MSSVLLTTINSSYFHSSFGLRYLYANLEELKSQSEIIEFTTQHQVRDIAEILLSKNPKIIGIGVYIWNARTSQDLVSMLKRIRPNVCVIAGGPEVSFETASQSICETADHTICGEADFLFRDVCRGILQGHNFPKIISGELPDIKQITLPYRDYSEEDISKRVIYVEASRGCPYRCEFCLSSLDKEVRTFDLDHFLNEMKLLLDRGVRQFKFVDRTFNLNFKKSGRILGFFLEHIHLGLFLHFEMVPDRLPGELKDIIKKFPPGSLQFEIGVQTFTLDVAKRVSRNQDFGKTRDNFRFLTRETDTHIHSDLIVGLPGETLESFQESFDILNSLRPHEIQIGILKRLRGTPITRHDEEWAMVYQEDPPYTLLRNSTLTYDQMQRLARFSKFWDLYANSGNFRKTFRFIEKLSTRRNPPSLFWEFWDFVLYLETRYSQRHGIALLSLVESLWVYLTECKNLDKEEVRATLLADYCGEPARRDVPLFLCPEGPRKKGTVQKDRRYSNALAIPPRQARHVENSPLEN